MSFFGGGLMDSSANAPPSASAGLMYPFEGGEAAGKSSVAAGLMGNELTSSMEAVKMEQSHHNHQRNLARQLLLGINNN
ncbi:unnamed protein product [Linum trigynum]|uniref:Uncharacterized protein n=1 Tax=Linum trigynum TaxID=586398 RepID=A0AAV2CID4_9ROSI